MQEESKQWQLARKLCFLRSTRLNLSQARLATQLMGIDADLHISQGAICQWEKNGAHPQIRALEAFIALCEREEALSQGEEQELRALHAATAYRPGAHLNPLFAAQIEEFRKRMKIRLSVRGPGDKAVPGVSRSAFRRWRDGLYRPGIEALTAFITACKEAGQITEQEEELLWTLWRGETVPMDRETDS